MLLRCAAGDIRYVIHILMFDYLQNGGKRANIPMEMYKRTRILYINDIKFSRYKLVWYGVP